MVLKKVLSAAVPAMIAVAAFFQAHAVGSLVDASVTSNTPAAIAPFKEARAAAAPARSTSGQAILDRNVFDSTAKPSAPLEATDIVDGDPQRVPICEGVRAVVTVRADKPESSFAALDVGGKRHLRKRGGEIDDLRLVYVGDDRVWLQRGSALCQAPLFAKQEAKPAAAPNGSKGSSPSSPSASWAIQKTGPNEYAIDRAEVSRILEAQAELMKTPVVPEKTGYRLVRVKPGSVLATLGLESGDRLESIDGISVTSAEGMMQAYARLSSGTLSHLSIHVVRADKPLNLDYTIK